MRVRGSDDAVCSMIPVPSDSESSNSAARFGAHSSVWRTQRGERLPGWRPVTEMELL